MNIPLNIILDRLVKYEPEIHMELPSDREVRGVKLVKELKAEPDPELLYVSELSFALSMDHAERANAVFICPRDTAGRVADPESALRNLIIINGDASLEEVFSLVQDVFCQLNSWYQNMMEAIIKNRSFQELIDISEEILGNYVQITDSSFKLLGYTRNTECDEEITVLARKYGFHPESTIQKFRKLRRFAVWDQSSDIFVNDERTLSRYPLISKVFRFSNTYFAHAVMVCSHAPLTAGLVDLYRLFTDIIGVYVEKEWESTRAFHHVYDAFLTDLYDGSLTRRDIIEERSRHVGIPVRGCFYLSVTSGEEEGRYSPELIAKDLSLDRPDDKIVVIGGRITVLSVFDESHYLSGFNTMRNILEKFMEKYDLRCGISSAFSDLSDAPKAMAQARRALSCSGRTPGAKHIPELEGALNGLEKRTVSFEESFCHILLGASPANREVWKNSIYYDALKLLDDYDRQHGMNNLHLLYTFLNCQSRLADTGTLLHMSRNNVAYRIDRIQQMIGMDLKIPSIRASLLISYIMLQLYEFE